MARPLQMKKGREESEAGVSYFSLFSLLTSLFKVFVVAISRYNRSLQSLTMLACSFSVMSLVSFKRSSQYSVSAHSLRPPGHIWHGDTVNN